MNIYIINLQRSALRRSKMEQKIADFLDKHPTFSDNFIFFDAIDGTNPTSITPFEKYNNNFLAKLYRGKPLLGGERACFASHFSLWERCLRENEPICVLEDDVNLLENFADGLGKIKASAHKYVRFMWLFDKKSQAISDDFVAFFGNVGGTQGYYLTPLAARSFIAHAQTWLCAVDDYMDMFYIHGVANIALKTPIISAEWEGSEIGSNRAKRPSAFWRLSREIARLIFQLRKAVYLLLCGGRGKILKNYSMGK